MTFQRILVCENRRPYSRERASHTSFNFKIDIFDFRRNHRQKKEWRTNEERRSIFLKSASERNLFEFVTGSVLAGMSSGVSYLVAKVRTEDIVIKVSTEVVESEEECNALRNTRDRMLLKSFAGASRASLRRARSIEVLIANPLTGGWRGQGLDHPNLGRSVLSCIKADWCSGIHDDFLLHGNRSLQRNLRPMIFSMKMF